MEKGEIFNFAFFVDNEQNDSLFLKLLNYGKKTPSIYFFYILRLKR